VVERDGTHWVPVKSLCRMIGVTPQFQIERFRRLGGLASTIRVPGGDGKDREMVCIPLSEARCFLDMVTKAYRERRVHGQYRAAARKHIFNINTRVYAALGWRTHA
jgi:hypothetical protein